MNELSPKERGAVVTSSTMLYAFRHIPTVAKAHGIHTEEGIKVNNIEYTLFGPFELSEKASPTIQTVFFYLGRNPGSHTISEMYAVGYSRPAERNLRFYTDREGRLHCIPIIRRLVGIERNSVRLEGDQSFVDRSFGGVWCEDVTSPNPQPVNKAYPEATDISGLLQQSHLVYGRFMHKDDGTPNRKHQDSAQEQGEFNTNSFLGRLDKIVADEHMEDMAWFAQLSMTDSDFGMKTSELQAIFNAWARSYGVETFDQFLAHRLTVAKESRARRREPGF